ncbi:hypothetical protein FACS1894172_09300 [Spirochaetia bacterium]|nr:hypothetical protein FACS1894164_11620 [Spirochaetia bacterium]GHU32526.1 hypothetical protein FACS1894172_09300 [Spirochaetia bacterium]
MATRMSDKSRRYIWEQVNPGIPYEEPAPETADQTPAPGSQGLDYSQGGNPHAESTPAPAQTAPVAPGKVESTQPGRMNGPPEPVKSAAPQGLDYSQGGNPHEVSTPAPKTPEPEPAPEPVPPEATEPVQHEPETAKLEEPSEDENLDWLEEEEEYTEEEEIQTLVDDPTSPAAEKIRTELIETNPITEPPDFDPNDPELPSSPAAAYEETQIALQEEFKEETAQGPDGFTISEVGEGTPASREGTPDKESIHQYKGWTLANSLALVLGITKDTSEKDAKWTQFMFGLSGILHGIAGTKSLLLDAALSDFAARRDQGFKMESASQQSADLATQLEIAKMNNATAQSASKDTLEGTIITAGSNVKIAETNSDTAKTVAQINQDGSITIAGMEQAAKNFAAQLGFDATKDTNATNLLTKEIEKALGQYVSDNELQGTITNAEVTDRGNQLMAAAQQYCADRGLDGQNGINAVTMYVANQVLAGEIVKARSNELITDKNVDKEKYIADLTNDAARYASDMGYKGEEARAAMGRYVADKHLAGTLATQETNTYLGELGLTGTKYTADVQAATEKYKADLTEAAARYCADKGLEGIEAQAEAGKYIAEVQERAAKYAADKGLEGVEAQAAATEYAAMVTAKTQEYAADKTLTGTQVLAKAQQYGADQTLAGVTKTAEIGLTDRREGRTHDATMQREQRQSDTETADKDREAAAKALTQTLDSDERLKNLEFSTATKNLLIGIEAEKIARGEQFAENERAETALFAHEIQTLGLQGQQAMGVLQLTSDLKINEQRKLNELMTKATPDERQAIAEFMRSMEPILPTVN